MGLDEFVASPESFVISLYFGICELVCVQTDHADIALEGLSIQVVSTSRGFPKCSGMEILGCCVVSVIEVCIGVEELTIVVPLHCSRRGFIIENDANVRPLILRELARNTSGSE